MYLPYKTYELVVPHAPEDVSSRIGGWVEERRFLGKVGPRSFWLMRPIKYQNSFLPVLSGKVEPTSGGAKIRYRVGLHMIVVSVLAVFAVSGSFFLPDLLPVWIVLMIAGVLAVGAALSFAIEGPRILRLFGECLKAEDGLERAGAA